jgi:biopolymer transport protein ExbD
MAISNFEREDLQAPLAEINMTPLVDVMLVLLVIFLVTAPMLNNAIKLDLPSDAAAEITEEKALSITIDASGNYFLNDKKISASDLQNEIHKAADTNAKQQIRIFADTNVNYGKVSHILAMAQKYGLSNIGFVTEPR